MKEREVFRCDIRNLLFNMCYMDDKIGNRLVAAVQEARSRMYCDDNMPHFDSAKEGMRILQRQKDAKGLQELMIDDTMVLYEIPLKIAKKKYRQRPKRKMDGASMDDSELTVTTDDMESRMQIEPIQEENEQEDSAEVAEIETETEILLKKFPMQNW